MNRRDFIKFSGWTLLFSLLPFGMKGWAAGLTTPSQLDEKTRKRLIVVFQRGAVDGLNIVIPSNENNYFDLRPTIAVPSPETHRDSLLSALLLTQQFGLNPMLESVMPLWKQKSLAFVHACGSPDPSRSHFEAQDYMETGTPGVRITKDGWLNRLLSVLSSPNSSPQALKAISMGSLTPLILQGKAPSANYPSSENPMRPLITDRPQFAQKFGELYQNDKALEEMYEEGLRAHQQLLSDLEIETSIANHGAPTADNFVRNAYRLAEVMATDPAMQIAFLDVGGWDTHINQNAQLKQHLKPFGDGISALAKGLGDAFRNTLIVIISEFGRTVKENGHGGTDHGHGNVLWALGGPIRGGNVYGQWPGLAPQELYQNRDLAVTTDFRQVLGHLIGSHFQISQEQVAAVFPNTPAPSSSILNSYKDIYSPSA